MIEGENKILQAFLGTLMTWGLTAAGSALVFIFSSGKFSGKRKFLDGSLGFAAGEKGTSQDVVVKNQVMTAASFWSLMAPAIDKAEELGYYGDAAFVPVAIGFVLGGLFVLLSDWCIPHFGNKDPALALAMHTTSHRANNHSGPEQVHSTVTQVTNNDLDVEILNRHSDDAESNASGGSKQKVTDEVELTLRQRKTNISTPPDSPSPSSGPQVVLSYEISETAEHKSKLEKYQSWKRILLLIIAITVHNIPEGLAVGVSFGAIGSTKTATFEAARNLAIGIGIQNFPEGMAVSVPLCAAGYSPLKSFWYGQLSGLVEPIFGVLGALIVIVAEPLLPYALSFAAGAMIYVVVDDIIPEAQMGGNGRVASWGCMLGFTVMMCLDVGLG